MMDTGVEVVKVYLVRTGSDQSIVAEIAADIRLDNFSVDTITRNEIFVLTGRSWRRSGRGRVYSTSVTRHDSVLEGRGGGGGKEEIRGRKRESRRIGQ